MFSVLSMLTLFHLASYTAKYLITYSKLHGVTKSRFRQRKDKKVSTGWVGTARYYQFKLCMQLKNIEKLCELVPLPLGKVIPNK